MRRERESSIWKVERTDDQPLSRCGIEHPGRVLYQCWLDSVPEMVGQKGQEEGEMKRAIVIALVAVLLGGCILTRRQDPVMRESIQYALIPAGTEFEAKFSKNGPLEKVKLDRDVMVVDKGYLIKLQKDANRNALGIPD